MLEILIGNLKIKLDKCNLIWYTLSKLRLTINKEGVMELWEKMLAESERRYEELEKQDREAQNRGQLVGRYISQGVADGSAYYQIIRENKKTVRIRLFEGISDDYRVAYWGYETTINKEFAVNNIHGRDSMRKLFSK
jgi:hypothetical protein